MNPEVIRGFVRTPGMLILFKAFAEKYRSYGRFVTVKLTVTDEERVAIMGFLGKLLSAPTKTSNIISISASQFQKAIDTSPAKGYNLHQLIEETLGIELISKRSESEILEERKRQYIQSLSSDSPLAGGLLELLMEGSGDNSVISHYHKKVVEFEQIFPVVLKCLEKLPQHPPMRIPVFAAFAMGDPHALDKRSSYWPLFFDCLLALSTDADSIKRKSSMDAEEVGEILLEFGLTNNELTSQIAVAGIRGECDKLEGAWRARRYIDLSLRDVLRLESVFLGFGDRVFVVENPSVYSALLDAFEDREVLPAICCTSGQIHVSAYRLFDKLFAKNPHINLFYSGDFDPAGLRILQKLYRRYPGRVVPWRYSPFDYADTLPTVTLEGESEVSKLSGVDIPELQETVDAISSTGRLGYQEVLIPQLVRDVEKYIEAFN